jgi:hypothetical protein
VNSTNADISVHRTKRQNCNVTSARPSKRQRRDEHLTAKSIGRQADSNDEDYHDDNDEIELYRRSIAKSSGNDDDEDEVDAYNDNEKEDDDDDDSDDDGNDDEYEGHYSSDETSTGSNSSVIVDTTNTIAAIDSSNPADVYGTSFTLVEYTLAKSLRNIDASFQYEDGKPYEVDRLISQASMENILSSDEAKELKRIKKKRIGLLHCGKKIGKTKLRLSLETIRSPRSQSAMNRDLHFLKNIIRKLDPRQRIKMFEFNSAEKIQQSAKEIQQLQRSLLKSETNRKELKDQLSKTKTKLEEAHGMATEVDLLSIKTLLNFVPLAGLQDSNDHRDETEGDRREDDEDFYGDDSHEDKDEFII